MCFDYFHVIKFIFADGTRMESVPLVWPHGFRPEIQDPNANKAFAFVQTCNGWMTADIFLKVVQDFLIQSFREEGRNLACLMNSGASCFWMGTQAMFLSLYFGCCNKTTFMSNYLCHIPAT